MFDTHVHTTFSTDSEMKIECARKYARENAMSLIITEHMDINFPQKDSFRFDVDKYFREYSRWRNDNLLLGIELGMKEDCLKESRELIENNPFDYVIGSTHLVDNKDLYSPDYYRGKSKKETYSKYFQAILDNLSKFDFIDSLGHIDYIARYSGYEDSELYCSSFSEIIDEIFKKLIDQDKCLELNTRRLGNKSAIQNMIEMYKKFGELGGKYITIGSDAHNSYNIGSNFKSAVEIAGLCNLKVVYFKNRKKEYDKNLL
ncbi:MULTISPECIES: histidinol phosphate phosphatase [Clostridium]|uniref:Histidinol-phosphatase n=1 Tax=Clostridium lapidicellarium TaxID=3240931 RepID=A0ABV4DSJ7_9CLOT|nr:histidinol phosphate phosphatase [uncultured Clostridium sp.]